MQLSNVIICHMSVEVEHKQIFHFMPMKLTLSYIKEHNVDLKVFGASAQMNDGYSVVYFSNLRVGVPSFHCCFRLHGSQGCSLASSMVSGACLEHQVTLVSVVDLGSGQQSVLGGCLRVLFCCEETPQPPQLL